MYYILKCFIGTVETEQEYEGVGKMKQEIQCVFLQSVHLFFTSGLPQGLFDHIETLKYVHWGSQMAFFNAHCSFYFFCNPIELMQEHTLQTLVPYVTQNTKFQSYNLEQIQSSSLF